MTLEQTFNAAVTAHGQARLADAIAGYEAVLQQMPTHAGALVNLATALKQAGRTAEALRCFERAVALADAPPEVWFNLGNLHASQGRAREAEQAWREALARAPQLGPAATRVANLLVAQGRAAEAMPFHRQALSVMPDNLSSLRGLARLEFEAGAAEVAEGLYRRALALDPAHLDTRNALGVVLKDLGRRDEAIACWQTVLQAAPRHAAALNNLGALYRLMHRREDAIRYLRAALAIEPQDGVTAANLAHALLESGQTSEAEQLARQIVAREPTRADGHHMLGFALAYQAQIEPALAAFRAAQTLEPASTTVLSNLLFASLYSDARSPAALLEMHREITSALPAAAPPPQHRPRPASSARALRVGYLSPDLRSHPVAVFFEPILTYHARDAFEIFCYSTTNAPDEVTARLMAKAAHWRDCAGLPDAKIAARIAADGIDVLIDLAGYTAQNRCAVLRAKPAPVQALYIGYPGSSCLPEVDWLIADEHLIPPADEAFYTERIARVDSTFWCFQPPADAPPVGPPPSLARGQITFGSYNAYQKITDTTVALWAAVLRAVPDARLLLKALQFADPVIRSRAAARFVAAGIEPSRIEIRPPVDHDQALAAYADLDIALDPTPYNGATTSCEALWMGVPVLSLRGDRFSARMGHSILQAVGLPTLVADSPAALVERAAALAADPAGLAALRAGLRPRMAAARICDAEAGARALERVIRQLWAAYATSPGAPSNRG